MTAILVAFPIVSFGSFKSGNNLVLGHGLFRNFGELKIFAGLEVLLVNTLIQFFVFLLNFISEKGLCNKSKHENFWTDFPPFFESVDNEKIRN